MASTVSINSLVTQLCLKQWNLGKAPSTPIAYPSRLKYTAYSILLQSYSTADDELLSNIDQLLAHAFQLRSDGRYMDSNRLEKLATGVSSVIHDPVLKLLLALSGTDSKTKEKKRIWSSIDRKYGSRPNDVDMLNVDCPPVYGKDYGDPRQYYMHFPSSIFENIDVPSGVKDFTSAVKNIFELTPGMDERGRPLSCSGTSPDVDMCKAGDLFGSLRNHRATKVGLNVRLQIPELDEFFVPTYRFDKPNSRSYKLSQSSDAVSEDEGFLENDYTSCGEIWEAVAAMKPHNFYTWESVGRANLKKAKPYFSEADPKVMNRVFKLIRENLLTINSSLIAYLPDPVLVDTAVLLTDIVHALIGIPSANFFKVNDTINICPGIHIDGVGPETMSSALACIVQAANNFLQLSSLSKTYSSISHQGLVFRAFTSAIKKYLSAYEVAILGIDLDSTTFMQLVCETSHSRDQLQFVAEMCSMGDACSGRTLPSGIDLLSYVYKIAVDNWHSDNYALVLFLLRASCNPYFKFLQDWIFEGRCVDAFGEYMIQGDEVHLDSRDRSYWTHGYMLLVPANDKDNVPTFLNDIGRGVFLCGKSLNLLKLCDPHHYMCKVDSKLIPDLSVTFSDQNLRILNDKCNKYTSHVSHLATQPTSVAVTVRDINQNVACNPGNKTNVEEPIIEPPIMPARFGTDKVPEEVDKKLISKMESEVIRMSITEDDEGLPTFNLNIINNSDRTAQHNLNDKIAETLDNRGNDRTQTDDINKNVEAKTELINNNVDVIIENVLNSPKVKRRMKNRHGHSSDSTAQNIMYNQNNAEKSASAKVDDPVCHKQNVHGAGSRRQLSSFLKMADLRPFSYDKEFPSLGFDPNPDIMENGIESSSKLIAEDEAYDIKGTLDIPLAVLFSKCLLQPVFAQVKMVNEAIVSYFMKDQKINDHFKILRSFLFLQDGEFGHMLCEKLFAKMSSCADESEILNPVSLNDLLAQSLASSLHGTSPYVDNLSFFIKMPGTHQNSNVSSILSCLLLNYQVYWPNNIIITEKDMLRYNKVFGFIVRVKHSVWILNDAFFHLKQQAVKYNLDCSPHFRQIQIFRHEMQHFARVLQSYIVSQVLQITWQEFQDTLAKEVNSLDDLRQAHSSYLNKACVRCLLNDKASPVVKIIDDIFALIIKFKTQIVSHCWTLNTSTGHWEHPKFQSIFSFYKIFRGYAQFLCKVLKKLAEHGYQPHFQEFLLRLDINDHFIEKP